MREFHLERRRPELPVSMKMVSEQPAPAFPGDDAVRLHPPSWQLTTCAADGEQRPGD